MSNYSSDEVTYFAVSTFVIACIEGVSFGLDDYFLDAAICGRKHRNNQRMEDRPHWHEVRDSGDKYMVLPLFCQAPSCAIFFRS